MNKIKLILFCTILSTVLLSAQDNGELSYNDNLNLPKGELGKVIQNLIKVFNSNDSDKIKLFIEENFDKDFQTRFSVKAHVGFLFNIYSKNGKIQFHSIREYNPKKPDQFEIIYKNQNYGSWEALIITFKDNLISGLRFSPAKIPSNVKIQKITKPELIQETKNLIDKLCKSNHFSGAILLAKGEDVLYEDACGEASKRFHVANKIDTKFNLGSMNKMFTAVAIMQLVEKGIVKLNNPISKYIDESWLSNEITNKVTIHHLLSHSSGLGSYFNKKYWESSRQLYRTVEEFKPLVKNDKLAFEPGERFQYSNTGMLLLGVIIEKVTNQDYFEYIRQKIYKPALMNNSDAYDMDQPVENLAIGYVSTTNNKYGWENNIYKHVIKGGPAGGGFSTVKDIHKFAIALTQEKLISKSSLKLLWTDYYNSNYGYGFGVNIINDEKIVGHSGGFPGLNSQLDIFLDQGYIIVVMSNYDSGASPVARRVQELISNID